LLKRAIIALAAAIFFTGTPASAQFGESPGISRPNDGTFQNRFDSEQMIGDPQKAAEAYAAGATIGRCVVSIGGDGAAKLMGGPNTKDEGYRALSRALDRRYSACNHGGGSVPPMVVNYGIAEALVQRELDSPLDDRAMTLDVDKAQAFQGDSGGATTMDSIARCLAVYSPGLAQKVVQSDFNSQDEAAALQKLYGATPECGLAAPPSSVAPAFQRGSLAVALYQWTHANS